MARCQICGKGPAKGKRIIRTGTGKWIKKRVEVRRMPNLQKATILEKGEEKKIRVCTGCLKKLKKEGKLVGNGGKGNLAKAKVE
ncbi:50S ribosomal protein L28 [Candidatus Shapirobacteria bacterium]|nr:50S ribosomal protein L28 [Candidatus Shapirobacteria bacterium]